MTRTVTTRVVFLFRVLLGIAPATAIRSIGYNTGQSISAIPSRLQSRIFLLFRVVMRSRTFLLLRSSHQEVLCEKGFRPATLLKKRRWHRCFPVNFVKFLRASFLTEHLRWLLLAIPRRLHRVDYFCYSVQVMYGVEHLLSAFLNRLYRVDDYCYSKLIIQRLFILSRNFLQFCAV